ncbi:hypothetical protein D3C71_1872940 [compost metagenome]
MNVTDNAEDGCACEGAGAPPAAPDSPSAATATRMGRKYVDMMASRLRKHGLERDGRCPNIKQDRNPCATRHPAAEPGLVSG